MKRQKGESMEAYRKRRKKVQQETKEKLKPRLFHRGGTYIRPKRKKTEEQ